MRALIPALLLFSCTIIPEDALDYLPTKARIKSVIINDYDDNGNIKNSTIGDLSYQGTFDKPSKIEITWSGNLKIMQIPIFDKTNKITKTTYELTNGKVSKITNINSQNKEARIENFTYDNAGKLTLHTLRNNYNGTLAYEFTNNFFYKNGEVDSVYQTVCFNDQTCWNGFMVALNQKRVGNGCYGAANFVSIIPYDSGLPYQYCSGLPRYYNEDFFTDGYYSQNDAEKMYYWVNEEARVGYYDYDIVKEVSSNLTRYSLNDFGEVSFEGEQNFASSFSAGGYGQNFLGIHKKAHLGFSNEDEQFLFSAYYYLVPDIIPQANLLVSLLSKIDYLYYLDKVGDFEPLNESASYGFDIEYHFEVSK